MSAQSAILPIKATRTIEPALWLFQQGLERYPVHGGGSVTLEVRTGDELTVTDLEGQQACEVVAFSPEGRPDLGALEEQGDGPAEGLKAIAASQKESARQMRMALERRGIDFAKAEAIRLFGGSSQAGASASFAAARNCILVIAAPGEDMRPDEQAPPTDLSVTVKRARRINEPVEFLPDPLADPRLDFRIDRATAQSYEVKAGEFIQILDVAGRQCSDFLAFNQRQLDQGIERGLDATTTRTLMGAAYPGPGLHSKFFDPDMQPLLEVVRDTVGRHDTFGLACTAKYYEDMGYPGHVNCSENFNAALAPNGVAARKGWPAINLFFNTGFDETNTLFFHEPWSRPGDYVLMQAATDLTCASSACPCDVDPANGWLPTDIHVRVYPKENVFSKAIAIRMTPDAEPKLTRETGFHPRVSALTRDLTEYRGFWLANSYRDYGAIDEYWACREKAIVMDLSALRKFEVVGPDAEALLQHCLTRNVRRLSVGQVSYSAMCYDNGGMIDDGTVLRLGDDNFRWVCGDDYSGVWLREQAERLGLKAWVRSSTDQLHNLSVQGPKSREILKRVIWTPPAQATIEELGWFRFTIGRLGDLNGPAVVVSRTGYTGELGYEVWCHPKDAVQFWDMIWEAGQPHGLAPLGLAGLDMLRIEAGLIFAGYEFNDQLDPFEAGIGFTVPLKSKEDDFIGRAALLERKEHPQRKLVGLELDGNEVAGPGDCVHIGRAQVGVVTSATRSPILKKSVALCRMDLPHTDTGTEVEVGRIDGHQLRLPAKVVPFPFYDPEKTRVRA